jgi:hypothetical protein
MFNVTNKSLLAAGVDPDLWPRAKKICNSPVYKAKRAPYRAEGGPFSTHLTGEPIWLDEGSTAPIKVGGEVGYYKSNRPAIGAGLSARFGVVTWVKLA